MRPSEEFHFHTGRPLAARLGYEATVVDDLPDRAVESFAGWPTRSARGTSQVVSGWWTSAIRVISAATARAPIRRSESDGPAHGDPRRARAVRHNLRSARYPVTRTGAERAPRFACSQVDAEVGFVSGDGGLLPVAVELA